MLFGLYFANLLFYVTGVVMVVRGVRILKNKFNWSPDAERVVVAFCAAILAPALASLGHLMILVPFALYPRYHLFGRGLLPINIVIDIATVVITLIVQHRRTVRAR